MILETGLFFLRKMTGDDFEARYTVLADSSVVAHHPCSFDKARVRSRIRQSRERYTREAAAAVRDRIFSNTAYDMSHSYCNYTSLPSIRTAETFGMRFPTEYPAKTNGPIYLRSHRRKIRKIEMTAIKNNRPPKRSRIHSFSAGVLHSVFVKYSEWIPAVFLFKGSQTLRPIIGDHVSFTKRLHPK